MMYMIKELILTFWVVRKKQIVVSIGAGPLALLLYTKLASTLSVWLCLAFGLGIPVVLLLVFFVFFSFTLLNQVGKKEFFDRQPLADFSAKGFRVHKGKMLTGKIEGFYTVLIASSLTGDNQLELMATVYAEPAKLNKDCFEVAGTLFRLETEKDHLAFCGLFPDVEKTYTANQLYFLLTRVTETMREMKLEPAILEGNPDDW